MHLVGTKPIQPWAAPRAAGCRAMGRHAALARGLRLLLPALLWLAGNCSGAIEKRGPLRLIVRYKEGQVAAAAAGTGRMRPLAPGLNMYTLEVEPGSTLEDAAKQLAGMRGVLYVEEDGWVSSQASPTLLSRRRLAEGSGSGPPPPSPAQGSGPPPPRARTRRPGRPQRPPPPARRPPPPSPRQPVVPNDALFKEQWAPAAINAPQAWTLLRDSSSVLVCIVDSGVKWDHPDLAPNLVPMTAAYKTANDDDYGHGTHVAGIIGAVGNNRIGVAGVAFKASMLPCKALDSLGIGRISDVVRCIEFCRSSGARIINTSFSRRKNYAALQDAFRVGTQAGVFFSSAAGNYGNDTGRVPFYPGSYRFNGSVAVANLAQDNKLSSTSNYGASGVHLAAPGTNILSTYAFEYYQNRFYKFQDGTSMAAPFVSGAAALALAASGGKLTNVQLQQLLVSTSRPLAALQGKVQSGGVIDLHKLIAAAAAAATQAASTAAAKRL